MLEKSHRAVLSLLDIRKFTAYVNFIEALNHYLENSTITSDPDSFRAILRQAALVMPEGAEVAQEVKERAKVLTN